MSTYNDALGDELKYLENLESGRSGEVGTPVVVRVDGVAFSTFTGSFDRPFDALIAEAMDEATIAVVERLHPRIGYTQSDEMTFIFWDPDFEVPYAGRLQKLSSVCASIATGAFMRAALRLFPEKVRDAAPVFDGRANALPMPVAAKNLEWREIDARINAVSMAARQVLGPNVLAGKSSADMKEMMSEAGVEFRDYPERFLRGAYFRRMKVHVERTPEELARIPAQYRARAAAAKERTVVVRLTGVPPLTIVDNLEAFIFEGAEPVATPRTFASSVTP